MIGRRPAQGFRFHNFAQWGFWRKLRWQDTPVKQDAPVKARVSVAACHFGHLIYLSLALKSRA
jgi:hypothetical protein